MAIRINILYTFTIIDLVATLQKRDCVDGGKACMFVDMFRLKRVCLSVDGVCDKSTNVIKLGPLAEDLH
jgi:hypothetical protein